MEEDLSEHYEIFLLSSNRWFWGDLSKLRDGGLAGAEAFNRTLCVFGLELHSRAIVGSTKFCWVVDIHHDVYSKDGFLSILDSKLRWVNAIQALLDDWLKGRETRRALAYSFWKSCIFARWESSPQEPSEASIPSYAVIVSTVVLLSLVYHYLTGNVNRGGSKAYSRSSLDFRDIYVAIVLFLGAYVWIKFREVAFKGAHRRKLVDKKGVSKVVYDARLKPPLWDGKKVPRLDLGRFATAQEAHNKFLIAAFYYDRAGGWLDGWFQVPPMSDEERRFTGEKKRKWVIGQAKKVYENFKKGAEEVEAALVQGIFEACEGQTMQGHDEVNVDPCEARLLNSAEPQQPVRVSQTENSGMGMAVLDNDGLEYTSHSFDGMHEVHALSNGHSLGCQEGSALPVSQLPPNTESGMNLNGSDQLDGLQTQQQQTYLLQQQSSDQQQQIYLQQQQIQGLSAQIWQLQHQQRILQQQLQEPKIQNPQWLYQLYLQEQQLQDFNQGVLGFAMEMGQSIYQ